jgi:inhibitor of cysteine peptidase
VAEPTDGSVPGPSTSDYLPQAGDSNFSRGNVFIDSIDMLIMESYPIQVGLVLKGSLPTPCNQLRVVVNPPDEQNRIQIEAYSVIDPAQMCVQVLEPLDANIMLGSFPTGHYSVWVNGEMAGEFDS